MQNWASVAGGKPQSPTGRLAAAPLPQHEPPQENPADQQRPQHEGGHLPNGSLGVRQNSSRCPPGSFVRA